MKNHHLISFILLLVFSSCKKEKALKFPILIPAAYDTIIRVSSNEMLLSEPIVYGINIKDSLDFSKKVNFNDDNFVDNWSLDLYEKKDSILIFVDTSKNFHSDEVIFARSFPPPPPPFYLDSINEININILKYVYDTVAFRKKYIKRKRQHYNTFPVYIFNNAKAKRIVSKSIINGDLYLQVQAKNENGDWKSIEYNYVPGFICGTGHFDYLLKPKHSIVSAIRKYSGDYKTKMRVKFMSLNKVYYSNEFEGEINYSQFNYVKEVSQMIKRFSKKNNERFNFKKQLILLDF